MTGMAAAELMLGGRVGLLRTVPPADPDRLESLRLMATELRVEWPDAMTYQSFVRSLSPVIARRAALLVEATTLLRGSGYVAFDGEPPSGSAFRTGVRLHARRRPLRRLVDRYVGRSASRCRTARRSRSGRVQSCRRAPEAMAKVGRPGRTVRGGDSLDRGGSPPRAARRRELRGDRRRARRAPRRDRRDPQPGDPGAVPRRRSPARRPRPGSPPGGERHAAPRALRNCRQPPYVVSASARHPLSSTCRAASNAASPNSTSRVSSTPVSASRIARSACSTASSGGHPCTPRPRSTGTRPSPRRTRRPPRATACSTTAGSPTGRGRCRAPARPCGSPSAPAGFPGRRRDRVTGRQPVRVARRAQRTTLLDDRRPALPVDRPVDAPAAEERRVRHALTIASTACSVMSPWTSSIRTPSSCRGRAPRVVGLRDRFPSRAHLCRLVPIAPGRKPYAVRRRPVLWTDTARGDKHFASGNASSYSVVRGNAVD